MTKTPPRPLRKFEDLTVGEERISQRHSVSEAEIIAFARQYDPQWFHTDPEAAKISHFGQVVASGAHSFALWRRLDHEINADVDYVCGLGFNNFRLKNALRPGDTIYATSKLLALEPSKSGKARGTAIWHNELRNGRDDVILEFDSINLVYTRDAPQ